VPSSTRCIYARSGPAPAHIPGTAVGTGKTRPVFPTSLRLSHSSSSSSTASLRQDTAARRSSALHDTTQAPDHSSTVM